MAAILISKNIIRENGLYQNLIAYGLLLLKMFQAEDWSRGARPPRAHNHAPRGVTRKKCDRRPVDRP